MACVPWYCPGHARGVKLQSACEVQVVNNSSLRPFELSTSRITFCIYEKRY